MTDEKDTITDLCERFHLLRLRYNVVFREPTHANPPYIPMAEALANGLAKGDHDAVIVAKSLIDPADLSQAEFWATPLGRLLFLAGGTEETVSQTVAASVLGCSRQWVNAMIKEEKLDATFAQAGSTAHREVFADQIRTILKNRIDRLVK